MNHTDRAWLHIAAAHLNGDYDNMESEHARKTVAGELFRMCNAMNAAGMESITNGVDLAEWVRKDVLGKALREELDYADSAAASASVEYVMRKFLHGARGERDVRQYLRRAVMHGRVAAVLQKIIGRVGV